MSDIEIAITANAEGADGTPPKNLDFRDATNSLRGLRAERDVYPLPEPYEGMAQAIREEVRRLGLPVTAAPTVVRRALWLVADDCYALTAPIVQEANRVTSDQVAQVRYGLGYQEVPTEAEEEAALVDALNAAGIHAVATPEVRQSVKKTQSA